MVFWSSGILKVHCCGGYFNLTPLFLSSKKTEYFFTLILIKTFTMSTTSMFVLFSMFAAASAAIELQNCRHDIDCRTYGDSAAACVGRACDCTAPDTTEFCSANSTAATTGVSYVFVFNFDCDRFFTSSTLRSRIRLSIEAVLSPGEVSFELTFSCGSVRAVVAGDVATDQIAKIGADLTTQIETGLVGTDMEGLMTESETQLDSASSSSRCTVAAPAATAVYVSEKDSCTVTSCVSGYEITAPSPAYIATCTVVADRDLDTDDDDLSDGAIAAIVLGCVGVVALIIAAIFILLSKKSDAPEAGEQKGASEPFEDVVV